MNKEYLTRKGDNRRNIYSLNKLKELTAKSSNVVNWYPYTHDKTIRGPHNRWLTVSGGDDEYTAPITDDVEYAAAAMNSLPYLLEQIDMLIKENDKLKHDLQLSDAHEDMQIEIAYQDGYRDAIQGKEPRT
jgi:hypothetical protein